MAVQLTDKLVKALPAPPSGNRISYDAEVRGLGVRVTSAGAKAWVFGYRAGGIERRMTIGDASAWTVRQARDRARELRRQVDAGEDPMAARHADRAAPTVNDLADRFEAEHLPKKRASTQDEYRRLLRNHIRPALGGKRVADLRHADVDGMHRKIAVSAPYAANRAVAVVSKMLSLAVKWEIVQINVARGIERAPEEKRERYLTPAEIVRLGEVIAAHPERVSANAVRFLLLTGARKSEVLGAPWTAFDLAAGVWVKPSAATKQAKLHRVPLSAPARALLAAIRVEADRENARRLADGLAPLPWVFPGANDNALGDIKHFWAAVTEKAGLGEYVETKGPDGKRALGPDGKPVMAWRANVRIHDLRHTYASVLASAGLSLPVIGALLGHTQASTTQRYAHLMDDPLRAATERAGAIITRAAQAGGEVVPMMGGRP